MHRNDTTSSLVVCLETLQGQRPELLSHSIIKPYFVNIMHVEFLGLQQRWYRQSKSLEINEVNSPHMTMYFNDHVSI